MLTGEQKINIRSFNAKKVWTDQWNYSISVFLGEPMSIWVTCRAIGKAGEQSEDWGLKEDEQSLTIKMKKGVQSNEMNTVAKSRAKIQ